MSDTGTFGFVGNGVQFPGKSNVVRDSSGSNGFGWENLNVGNFSVVCGYRNKATGNLSFAFGGLNTSSGGYAGAFGLSNSASGLASFASGHGNTVSGSYSSAFGSTLTVSGNYSFSSGLQSTSSGSYSFSVGYQNWASSTATVAIGVGALASRYGEFAHGCTTADFGLAQHGWIVLANQSTSSTPILLYANGINASQNAIIATGARWKCTLEIMATTTGVINKSASWEYKFQIDRPTTAATTIIRTTPLLTLSDGSNSGAPPTGWAVAITADTTNGCPQIQVTGDTDTINWTAALHYVQSIRV